MAEQLHQGDAAELERLGLIRYVGSDDEAFGFELTDAGRRYAPILARMAAAGVSASDGETFSPVPTADRVKDQP